MEPSETSTKTFFFTSGELCHLDDQQIQNIPYLSATVSAAQLIPSMRDDRGFYKLDSRIQHFDFDFVLKSFSFNRIRLIFTHLPKRIDILTIIDLYDFLGLTSIEEPTFEEVDLTFFSTMIYKPSKSRYIEKIREFELQDMAVRFAIALARETYDGSNSDVIDQIYWFVMFILSAYDYFGPRLRHHVHRIAEHYFSMHSPGHLEPLSKTVEREKEGKITVLDSVCEDFGFYEKTKGVIRESGIVSYLEKPLIAVKPDLMRRSVYRSYRSDRNFRWSSFYSPELRPELQMEETLAAILTRLVDTMYERLQYQINKRFEKFLHEDNNMGFHPYRSRFNDLFGHQIVKEAIDVAALPELRKILPTLQKNHEELVKGLRECQQIQELATENGHVNLLLAFQNYDGHFESYQEQVLEYVNLLEEMDEGRPFIGMQKIVIDRLHKAVVKQIEGWQTNNRKICAIKDLNFSERETHVDSHQKYPYGPRRHRSSLIFNDDYDYGRGDIFMRFRGCWVLSDFV